MGAQHHDEFTEQMFKQPAPEPKKPGFDDESGDY